MPKITKPLSPTEVKAAKPKEKDYSLFDGDGLELVIKKDGSRYWQFRYTKPADRKRTRCQFGSYPAVGLAEARALRESAKALFGELTTSARPFMRYITALNCLTLPTHDTHLI